MYSRLKNLAVFDCIILLRLLILTGTRLWLPSFNIDGQTVLRFDALNVFGSVAYDNRIRRLRLDIYDGLNYKISPPSLIPGDNPSILPNGLYFKLDSANGVRVRWSAYSLFYR